MPAPDSLISATDLIGARERALARRQEDLAIFHSRVESDHAATIKDFDFQRGALVLMRNIAIKKSFNCKMRPRYLGPYVVLSRNRGGAYILYELDGSALDRPVAAFRLLPYLARERIKVPWLDDRDHIDISTARLRETKASVNNLGRR